MKEVGEKSGEVKKAITVIVGEVHEISLERQAGDEHVLD